MTSQTLINNRSSQISAPVAPSLNPSGNPTALEIAKPLPYQASHQVELLHLQAETEALLQEIQTAKLQRLNSLK
jgi:hypothetical protein